MICSITLPDEVFQKYAEASPESPQKGIEKQLIRFVGIPVDERPLVFSSEERKEIEKLFGRPLEAAGDLVKWVKKLQEIEVGGVTVALTEGQVKRLQTNAHFFNQKPETMLVQKVQTALLQALGG